MKKELVEILSNESNYAVIKHPNRNYPGSLIQGDSLNVLINEIQEALQELAAGNSKDAAGILEIVLQNLKDRMEIYKSALKEHNIELPFKDT